MINIILAIQWLLPFLRPRHVGKNFEGKEIVMDLADYHHCKFYQCNIVYNGGPADFTHNNMDCCSFVFGGAAGRALKVLHHFGSIAPELVQGTFSNPLRRDPS